MAGGGGGGWGLPWFHFQYCSITTHATNILTVQEPKQVNDSYSPLINIYKKSDSTAYASYKNKIDHTIAT